MCERCKQLEAEIEKLNTTIDVLTKGKVTIKVSDDEYRLPDTLDVTIKALKRLGKISTASDVSSISGRTRSVESHYLTILERFGIVKSRKQGRKKYFELV